MKKLKGLDFSKDWHYNLLGIYNINRYGSFSNLVKFIRDNHNAIEGDIVEAGVFRGHSLISLGLLLKQLGSDKLIYGFDTFSGFPPIYDKKDNIDEFRILFEENLISKQHYEDVKLNKEILTVMKNIKESDNVKTISSSGKFDDTSMETIQEKLDLLELDNVRLIRGPFSETMNKELSLDNIMAAVIDCDLYTSYKECLRYIWPKLSDRGLIHLDEYYSLKFPGARRAVIEFFDDIDNYSLSSHQKDSDFERWFVTKLS